MHRPTVAVVISCYKQVQFLPDAINSIRSQTVDPSLVEIVVVGDTDAMMCAEKEGIKNRRLDPGYGNAYARNMGIKSSSSEYCVCVDSDDMLERTYLEKATDLAASCPAKYLIVSSNMMEFQDRQGWWDIPPYSQTHLIESNCLHCASFFSRELWEDSGGFEADLIAWEDWGTWVKMSRLSPQVIHIPERLLMYRVHSDNSTHAKHHLDDMARASIYVKNVDLYHNFPGRFDKAIATIARMDDDALDRVDKRLSQLPSQHFLRLFSMLAHQYRNGHPKTNEPSTHAYPINLFTR